MDRERRKSSGEGPRIDRSRKLEAHTARTDIRSYNQTERISLLASEIPTQETPKTTENNRKPINDKASRHKAHTHEQGPIENHRGAPALRGAPAPLKRLHDPRSCGEPRRTARDVRRHHLVLRIHRRPGRSDRRQPHPNRRSAGYDGRGHPHTANLRNGRGFSLRRSAREPAFARPGCGDRYREQESSRESRSVNVASRRRSSALPSASARMTRAKSCTSATPICRAARVQMWTGSRSEHHLHAFEVQRRVHGFLSLVETEAMRHEAI